MNKPKKNNNFPENTGSLINSNEKELEKVQIELKRSFEKFLFLFDNAPVGIVNLDNEGIIQSANRFFCDLIGISKSDLKGKYFSRFITNNFEQVFHNAFKNNLDSGENQQCEVRILNPVNKYFDVSIIFNRFLSSGSHPAENILIIEDRTKLRETGTKLSELERNIENIIITRTEELNEKVKKLEDSYKKSEESCRIKSRFFGNISHELRTPMVGILGFSELIMSESKDPDINEMASMIHSGGTRLLETLNLLLEYSKVETEKLSLLNKITDIKALINDVVLHYSAVLSNDNLKLKFSAEGNDFTALVDPELLKQVISYLVNNAIKYTKEGLISIVLISVGNNITVKIKDTGIGIPEEKLSFIFDEYRQVSEGLNRHLSGIGIGLTLAKRFIELMDGNISVSSKSGEGTEFTVTIPKNIHRKNPVNKNLEIPNRALIVDDDVISYSLMKNIVEEICPADIATNLDDAIKKISDNNYDFILMDINLESDDTGIDVTREIRQFEFYRNIPVIAVTAYALKGDKDMFLESGLDAYVSKPFTRYELLDTIQGFFREKIS